MVSPFDLVWGLLKQDVMQQVQDNTPPAIESLSSAMFEGDSKGYPRDLIDEMDRHAATDMVDELNRRITNQGLQSIGEKGLPQYPTSPKGPSFVGLLQGTRMDKTPLNRPHYLRQLNSDIN